MEFFVADAFTDRPFGGNAAGVVPLLDADFPPEAFMLRLAAELKHSETAFVRRRGPDSFHLRYFTPAAEIELCGHATVAAFSVLRDAKALALGDYRALTGAGELRISVERETVWMDMAEGRIHKTLSAEEALPVYRLFGLDAEDAPEGLPAAIVSTGLADIMLPVRSLARLNAMTLERETLIRLSEEHGVTGVHAFCTGEGAVSAHCRNFAPLYGIDEECATGTANGALTHYLMSFGLIEAGREQRFVQGEAMGRASTVLSRTDAAGRIRIGGAAALCMRGELIGQSGLD